MHDVVAGAETRFARRGDSSGAVRLRGGRLAATPRGRESREGSPAPFGAPLLVALAAPLPVELLPLVALLGLDLPAHFDVRGQLAQEPRRRVLVRPAEELTPPGEREVAVPHRAGDRDVAEPPLFLELALVFERARVREDALLHPGHEHDRELEPLHRVHRDEGGRGLRLGELVDVRDEGDLLHERRQLLVARQVHVVLSDRPQLEHIGVPLLALGRPVLQVRRIPGRAHDLVDDVRQIPDRELVAESREEPAERHHRGSLPFRDLGRPLRVEEGLGDGDLPVAREPHETGLALGADAPRGRVEHPPHRDAVHGIPEQPQVREHVLHLAPLIEGDAADHLVREAEAAEHVLDGSRLGVRPVEDRDVACVRDQAFAAELLDLAGDGLGLVMLVVRLDDRDRIAARPLGPELLLLARGVVAHDVVGRVEDPLGGPVVLLQLHDRRVRVVPLEVEDVADVRAAPREDRLVVVADHAEVLLEAREVTQEHVLRAVRVLVLVDQDVVIAVLPLFEGPVARLEQPAGKDEQIVEVDGVVLLEEGLVPAPHRRRDPVELAAGLVHEIRRAAELVLGRRDDGADRAGREEPLGDACLPHRLPEERPLVGGVVDGEAAVQAHLGAVTPQQPGAEGVEGARGEVSEGRVADELLQAAAQLLGRLVGEGDGHDLPRGDVEVADEIGDPMGQDTRLPGAGPSQDEQRT